MACTHPLTNILNLPIFRLPIGWLLGGDVHKQHGVPSLIRWFSALTWRFDYEGMNSLCRICLPLLRTRQIKPAVILGFGTMRHDLEDKGGHVRTASACSHAEFLWSGEETTLLLRSWV